MQEGTDDDWAPVKDADGLLIVVGDPEEADGVARKSTALQVRASSPSRS